MLHREPIKREPQRRWSKSFKLLRKGRKPLRILPRNRIRRPGSSTGNRFRRAFLITLRFRRGRAKPKRL